MIEVPLSSRTYPGLIAVIDDEDAALISGYTWVPSKREKTFYAYAYVRGTSRRGHENAAMHRLIAGAAPGQKVDHADRNGLNNTRANLRFGSDSQHSANQDIRADNTSGYRGVSWDKSKGNWLVYVRQRYVGRFDDPLEAARAYDRRARAEFGEFAVLNFPDTALECARREARRRA